MQTWCRWCLVTQGVGFGGPDNAAHVGHFALFVDSSCDQGMSRPIATFGTVASLASEQVFQVSAWRRLVEDQAGTATSASDPSQTSPQKQNVAIAAYSSKLSSQRAEGHQPNHAKAKC